MKNKEIRAEVITIGDELLIGQLLDTNTFWMSAELSKVGIEVIRKSTVGDNEADILQLFAEAEDRADIILITGGLGPTSDDLTKPCLQKYFNCGEVFHPEVMEHLEDLFASRSRELNESNRRQAYLPTACEAIFNKVGTAPGMWFEKADKVFISLPGVPYEMKQMMEDSVIPSLIQKYQPVPRSYRFLLTAGAHESMLSDKLAEIEPQLPPYFHLAYLPHLGRVDLRIGVELGENKENRLKELDHWTNKIYDSIEQHVFAREKISLEACLAKLLEARKLKLSVAESCSGGYIAHRFTSIAGSSVYFKGGLTPYSNDLKVKILGVDAKLIEKKGAVSEEVAIAMVKGVQSLMESDVAIATTGIAGPSGATDTKPVGLVYIAVAVGEKVYTKELKLTKKRSLNIELSATAAINLLRIKILDHKDLKTNKKIEHYSENKFEALD
ncbi:MAG: competence/damage-inducible protein A [Cyclobacteriaceae bacterium]|nr:competence/damage-inducible protein A [Cyclobacteriaceae bacterium]MCH8515906.1 competence/damage-inducible protein A [Cyclobacteriaceae bacterium]